MSQPNNLDSLDDQIIQQAFTVPHTVQDSGNPIPAMVNTATGLAARRSPRSVERLCGGQCLKDLTKAETALAIALAHLSGWSADRISWAIKKEGFERILAEDIWDHYWQWVIQNHGNSNDVVPQSDEDLMRAIIDEAGIVLEANDQPARPLNMTVRPVTVGFAAKWSPKASPPIELCENYDQTAREISKDHLFHKNYFNFQHLTPIEQPIVAKLGSTVELLFKACLSEWRLEMYLLQRKDPQWGAVNTKEQVALILQFLSRFTELWEDAFGSTDHQEGKSRNEAEGEVKSSEVEIRTTAFGCKLLLGMMMADRVCVVERNKKEERRRVCFEWVDTSTLEGDLKTCFICASEMSVTNENDRTEKAIKLVFCCNNVIGAKCLRMWCQQKGRGSADCPFCRSHFSVPFWTKLFHPKKLGRVTQPTTGSAAQTIASTNTRQRTPEEDLVLRAGEVARSRRRNRLGFGTNHLPSHSR